MKRNKQFIGSVWLRFKRRFGVVVIVASAISSLAQVSPEEHAKHHPGGGGGAPGTSTNSPAPGGMMGGGMGGPGGMGGMMEKMGAPKPQDLYPSMMNLPDLPPEKRDEIRSQAGERMRSGVALMSTGLDQLSKAAATENYAAMQEAVAGLNEGLAQFDSGLAASRALVEGKAPRNVALQWFKREMNLIPPAAATQRTMFGGTTFHLSVIVILAAFTIAMFWMYFFKMRRASALLQQLSSAGATVQAAAASPSISPQPTNAVTPAEPKPAPAEAPAEPVKPPVFPAMKSRTQPEKKWSGELRVCRIFDETPEVKTFRLAAENDVALPFTYYPGQFITLSLSIGGKLVKRSYTIASTPTQSHYCSITVKREEQGLVSRHLHDSISEGDLVDASGPNGKFTFTGDEADNIVLIAGGVGITPMMSVIRYLTDVGWGGEIHLLYCCRTTRDFIFRQELEQLQQRHSNLHVFATMTRAAGTVWMGLKGRFTSEILTHLVPEITTRRIHVCGPPAMMSAVSDMLKSLAVPSDLVKTEAFGPAKKPTAPKPAPSTEVAESVPATGSVVFKKSGKTVSLPADQTVLDAADDAGVEIDNSCRSGQCGLCKVKLLSGNVTMDCDDALSDEDKRDGIILACQAKANEKVEVDA